MAYTEPLLTACAAWALYAVLTGRWVGAGALGAGGAVPAERARGGLGAAAPGPVAAAAAGVHRRPAGDRARRRRFFASKQRFPLPAFAPLLPLALALALTAGARPWQATGVVTALTGLSYVYGRT
jgi:hypothetical protein